MAESILKPSEFAGYLLDGEDPISNDLSLNEILESEKAKETNEEDGIKIESEDSSLREGLDQLKNEMMEEDLDVDPIINVNVETPIINPSEKKAKDDNVSEANSSVTTNVTNNYITNIEESEKEPANIESSKPSEIIQTEAESKSTKEESDEVKVISENSPVPTDLIETQENAKIKEESENKINDITGDAVIRELARIENTISEKETQQTTETRTDTLPEPADVRIVSAPESAAILMEILNSESTQTIERTVPNQELPETPVNQANAVDNIDASVIISETLRESNIIPEIANVVAEDSSQIIRELTEKESIETEKLTNSFESSINTLLVPAISKLNDSLPDGITNLSEAISDNTSKLDQTRDAISSLPSQISEFNRTEKTFFNETTDVTVKNGAEKLTSSLTQAILATPEEKKLDIVSEKLTTVQNALREVNESQINNTNAINNISNTSNVITNNSEQNLTQSEPNSQTEVQKEEIKEQSEQASSVSAYYLQAIYDALVGQGIKIKGY